MDDFKKYFQKIYVEFGAPSWKLFVGEINKNQVKEHSSDNETMIELANLEKILLKHYNIKLAQNKRELFLSVNSKILNGKYFINVFDLPNTSRFNEQNKMY